MSGESSSLDAALNAGFGDSDAPDTTTPDEQASASVEQAQQSDEAGAPATAAPEAQQETRPRDASGKFAPRGQTPAPAPTAQQKGPQTPVAAKPEAPATPAAPELKPPQHWKAEAREEWAKLPRVVQEEALRVQGEVKRVMQEAARARAFHGDFEKLTTPYRALMSGEPLQVVGNLLQTAAALQTGTPAQRAQMVAQIIHGYGVDIPTLDAILAGQQPPETVKQAQQRPEQFRDPRVDEWLAREEQQKVAQAQRAVEAFAQEAEFLDEPWPGRTRRDGSPVTVRDLMANLIDSYARDGIDLPLKDAYAQVVSQHPEVSKVLRQREEARAAATAQATTQRVRAAASSVQSRPAARPPSAQKASLDDILESAFSEASGR